MEKLIPPLAFVLAIGLLYCLSLVRRGRLETDELTNALSASFLRNWTLTNELHAIREARSNGVTYTSDQVADWLRNLEAFASIGKMLAIKITGLWEVKAKHDADKAEKCLSCHKALTYEGKITFVPAKHCVCLRCIALSVAQRIERGEVIGQDTARLIHEALKDEPMEGLEKGTTRADNSLILTPSSLL